MCDLMSLFCLLMSSQAQFKLLLVLWPPFPSPSFFPLFVFLSYLPGRTTDLSVMSQEDDCSSLLSRLGSDSLCPRMKYGGMFCSVEGAFENKTLNFESFSPQTQRRRAARARTDDQERRPAARGQNVVFPSGGGNCNKQEVKMSN